MTKSERKARADFLRRECRARLGELKRLGLGKYAVLRAVSDPDAQAPTYRSFELEPHAERHGMIAIVPEFPPCQRLEFDSDRWVVIDVSTGRALSGTGAPLAVARMACEMITHRDLLRADLGYERARKPVWAAVYLVRGEAPCEHA